MWGSIALVASTNKMLILLNIALFTTLAVAEIPPYIQTCGRRNPQLNECIQNSVGAVINELRNGIPEINVPPLEPMIIDSMKLVDLPNFKASARDIKLYGLSNFKIKKLNLDLEKQQINVELIFKEITLDAEYDVNAKILFPVAGTGPINMVTSEIISSGVMNYKIVEHGKKQYMFFSSMSLKLFIRDYTSNFRPKEGPDSPLATAINAALANSRQEIIESSTPNLEKKITEEMLILANKICKSFTYDELFPDHE
ncbi:uncharacterized protein LOC117167295 [Belonocnema kinseyi]|uniref:uncharacterized protein LOC117167295 n=1 Tax=Belonocnema kinseyi TaxID=2817044 RepID=UPI00143D859D|nr:uncharacterized protein LOC117167295 [Belonocnema kinseyi]